MKIEKVNDHQIRCTLTKADLADRELKISELAYGTEKAKSLFRDMMQQAAIKFGFEAEDIPLMIEAIPLNSDCIVLIITKVEDPEELDTRFSKFAPSVHEDDDMTEEESLAADLSHTGEEVLDLFKKIKDHAASLAKAVPEAEGKMELSSEKKTSEEDSSTLNTLRIFTFDSFKDLLKPAALVSFYTGNNYLYKEPVDGRYFLVVTRANAEKEAFNKACNILSEYGRLKKSVSSSHSYYEEHFDLIAGPDALQKLNMA
ncbi:MAG: adaptor protein MecA [Lachnospiraceae bacterium]|nr:adaptor protein MecA [Lachnospiraceae bacterium]